MRIHRTTCRWGRRIGGVAVLLLLAGVSVAPATTLSPDHPVWSTPGVDVVELRRGLEHLRPRAAYEAAKQRDIILPYPVIEGGRRPQRILVVPVLYSDGPQQSPVDRIELERRLFDPTDPSSLRGYYEHVSAGRFRPEGLVTPWVRLPSTKEFYSNVRDGVFRGIAGSRALVVDAVTAAQDLVDLTIFDDDGPDGVPGSGDDDGWIDLLLVLHPDPGFELDPTQATATVAHQACVAGALDCASADNVLTPGDASARFYALCSVEGPLGVWAHELGHLLGLDDLYDLGTASAVEDPGNGGGLGIWSLMAGGAWGGGGDRPSHLDAPSRMLLGWGRHDRDGPGRQRLPVVSSSAAWWREIQPLGSWGRERFLLEAREPGESVVDGALPGGGVLVYRVDDALPTNDSRTGLRIQLLQADGREDLENRANFGDAGDPFAGSAEGQLLGADTNPSSQSRRPSLERVPPEVRIFSPLEGTYEVDVLLSTEPRFVPVSSRFRDDLGNADTFVRPGDDVAWEFSVAEESGAGAFGVSLSLGSVHPDLSVMAPASFLLQESGGVWTGEAIRITTTPTASGSLEVEWMVQVNGANAGSFVLPVVVGLSDGLAVGSFASWEPAVIDAGGETTFEPLAPALLPQNTLSGWFTSTAGREGYEPGAHVTLTSPWFAPPGQGSLVFWSRVQTELSQPGEAWDGGVLELLHPGGTWQAITPEGGPIIRIAPRSEAETRGLIGFGAGPVPWTAYEVLLPVSLPSRVRFRFAADASFQEGSWALAGLATDPPAPLATLEVVEREDNRVTVRSRVEGTLPGVSSIVVAYRRTPLPDWVDATPPQPLALNSARLLTFDLPENVRVAELGLFTQLEPRILLATTGYRREDAAGGLLSVFPNPSPGAVSLRVAAVETEEELHVWDVRGRLVRSLRVPPYSSLISWDGRDSQGQAVASGRYFIASSPSSPDRSVITLVR